jgi:hypothetical protein
LQRYEFILYFIAFARNNCFYKGVKGIMGKGVSGDELRSYGEKELRCYGGKELRSYEV